MNEAARGNPTLVDATQAHSSFKTVYLSGFSILHGINDTELKRKHSTAWKKTSLAREAQFQLILFPFWKKTKKTNKIKTDSLYRGLTGSDWTQLAGFEFSTQIRYGDGKTKKTNQKTILYTTYCTN